jgi:phosphoribosylformylglycinamidine cyclo-ligase
VKIVPGSWPEPPIFELIRTRGRTPPDEMRRVFNLGIGLIMIVPAAQADVTMRLLKDCGDIPYVIGVVEKGERRVTYA